MNILRMKFLLLAILIFNISCAQNYEWKKLQTGLYISDTRETKNSLVAQNDTLNIEMYMFNPDDTIDLNKPINGKPIKYLTTFSKIPATLNYDKELMLTKNSEYLFKKYNEKKIPTYSFNLNKISEEEANEIIYSVNKKYGVDFTEFMSNENENGESIVLNLTLQPHTSVDVQKIKKEFKKYIKDIKVLEPNMLIYIYKINT